MFNILSLSILGGLVTGTLTFFSFKLVLGFTFRELRDGFKRTDVQFKHTERTTEKAQHIGQVITLYMYKSEIERHALKEFKSVTEDIAKDHIPLVPQEDLHRFNCQIFLN